jgi:deazaflavin-dependent oxidoreductase (nitroreductase family)
MSRMQLAGFRRSGGGRTQSGIPGLVLHTVGAKSGEPRTALLGYLEDGPNAWLVVASLAGAARHPGWLYNLAKQPHATIELGDGRRIEVDAATLEGAALEAGWKRFEVDGPEYVKYLSKTDRALPIVRLAASEPQP